MVGIGGYGASYLAALDRLPEGSVALAAVVDPFPDRAEAATTVAERGVPLFNSLEDALGTCAGAELVIIASPIHLHVPHCVAALARGCHVLCDKPIGATMQEVQELIRARDAANRPVRIGYQWSYSEGIQALKRDIRAGRFGAPIRVKTCCLWPRTLSYFRRNGWAGRLRDEGVRPVGAGQPAQQRPGALPTQPVLSAGPRDGIERGAGAGHGRGLSRQRHRELRHRGLSRTHHRRGRGPVLRIPRVVCQLGPSLHPRVRRCVRPL